MKNFLTSPLRLFCFLTPVVLLMCCAGENYSGGYQSQNWIDTTANTLNTRIRTPKGMERLNVPEKSFANYITGLNVYPVDHPVHLFDGRIKSDQRHHVAVIKMDIPKKDLQQCADACIRLRAEYLWASGKYDDIHFKLTNGFRMEYSKWRDGMRLVVKGNSTEWQKKKNTDHSYACFMTYLETVFMYAGTISLYPELKSISPLDLLPGDVIIEAGSPGHAVMVADVATHNDGTKKILLMQSYMPAQEIHVINNPSEDNGNPWYDLPDGNAFKTADWTFKNYKVGRFAD